jgi:putative phosphoribosyl transferase
MRTSHHFIDRHQAGRELAAAVAALAPSPPVVVLALPRGGVPIGAQVARVLQAPLDLLLVRKIGAPWQRELAVAAIVDGTPPDIVIDPETSAATGVGRDWIDQQAEVEAREIERRRAVYLKGRAPVPVRGATVVVVDDGIATGTTMRAALKALRRRQPARLILAVPVAPSDTIAALRAEVDDIVCLAQPMPFHAIGCHYDDFHQVSDAEVLAALAGDDAELPSQAR